jgi:hypothetical protein
MNVLFPEPVTPITAMQRVRAEVVSWSMLNVTLFWLTPRIICRTICCSQDAEVSKLVEDDTLARTGGRGDRIFHINL